MIGTLINVVFTIIGIVCFVAGIIIVKEGIKKRCFEKSFAEGCGMLAFGVITLMWIIKTIF